MKSSAILNHQALVNRKFILNLLQNGQIYNSSRKSVQKNTYYLGLLSKKKYMPYHESHVARQDGNAKKEVD